MGTAANVTTGKPNPAGAIRIAPVGTPLPTSTQEALNEAFKDMGYVSEDGLTNSTNLVVEKIKDWGGNTVLVIQSSKEDTFKYKLIEIKNVEVLKHVYGQNNVSGTLDTGIVIKVNNLDVDEVSVVIDMILRDNTAKRIVIPSCKVSAVGDINYKGNEATGYETTVDCTPDAAGNTHYEYLLKPALPSA